MLHSAVRFSGKSNLRDFEVEAIFLLEARKKSRLQGRGCIFSRSPIVQVLAFWLVFCAVLMVPPATWSTAPRPAFENIAVVEEAVEHGVTAALSPSSFPQPSTGTVRGDQCAGAFVAAHDDLQELFRACGP
jgi:hypothetical protein